MKIRQTVGFILILSWLLAWSTMTQAALYVEGYVGGNTSNLGGSPTVIGGWRLGTWFVPEGALGFHYPNWMKYFGFYTDISISQLSSNRSAQEGTGYVATWGFLPVLRLGFVKDDEVPFGRFQPYLGVGPAVFLVRFNNFSGSEVAPALMLDGGVRYMLNKRFSLDLFLRYRYARPNIAYQLFSGGAGLAYHF
uniref:Outer membrane protein beta-barrel domain-containing protein n=1 Tax=Desulfobacca acetoxidans TaxID=60893 RepID=A0A7V6A3M9_9BACT